MYAVGMLLLEPPIRYLSLVFTPSRLLDDGSVLEQFVFIIGALFCSRYLSMSSPSLSLTVDVEPFDRYIMLCVVARERIHCVFGTSCHTNQLNTFIFKSRVQDIGRL